MARIAETLKGVLGDWHQVPAPLRRRKSSRSSVWERVGESFADMYCDMVQLINQLNTADSINKW